MSSSRNLQFDSDANLVARVILLDDTSIELADVVPSDGELAIVDGRLVMGDGTSTAPNCQPVAGHPSAGDCNVRFLSAYHEESQDLDGSPKTNIPLGTFTIIPADEVGTYHVWVEMISVSSGEGASREFREFFVERTVTTSGTVGATTTPIAQKRPGGPTIALTLTHTTAVDADDPHTLAITGGYTPTDAGFKYQFYTRVTIVRFPMPA
jgi:hypothetical protein